MSSNTNARAGSRQIAVIAAIVVLAGAAVIFYLASRPSGPPAAATSLASLLPADTPLLAWTTDLGSLIELGRDAGLDGTVLAANHAGFGEAVKKLGANPLTVEGLATLGIDTSGAVGLALTPAQSAGVIFALYVPMISGPSLPTRLTEIFDKLEVSQRVTIEEASPNGRPVSWLFPVREGQKGPGIAAFLEVDGGTLVLFPANDRRSDAGEVEKDIAAYVDLLGRGGETLDSAPAYDDALGSTDGALLAAFFNPGVATRSLELGDDSVQALFWIMASVKGAGFSLVEEGPALRLKSLTLLESAEVASGAPRDLSVLDLIPGHPVAGLHVAIDLTKALAELERTLPEEVYRTHPIVSALTARDSFLGVSEEIRILDLVNGEVGLFLGHLGDTPEATLNSLVGFMGAGNELTRAVVLRLIDTFLGARVVDERDVGGTTIFVLDSLAGSPGLMLMGGRLWFAGSHEALVSVAKGEKGNLTDGDRNLRIASVMREEGSVALYADLERIVAGLPALIGASIEERGEAGRLLGTLDYLTLRAWVEGASVQSEFALHAKGENFRTSTLAALLATMDGAFGEVRERRAEVASAHDAVQAESVRGEAEHNLHKIYYGAATHFETPSSNLGGDAQSCQFPPTVAATPAANCCSDGSGRCPGQSEVWSNSATWTALSFSLDSPHSCVYSFESSGFGYTAQFTAAARCDADCDGRATVYRMSGKAGQTRGGRFCEMSGERTFDVTEE